MVKKAIGVKERVQEEELPKGMNKEPNKGNIFNSYPIPSQLIDAYLGRLKVDPVQETRLVDISFEGRYPKLITQIVNTHAKTYIEQNLQRKYEASQIAVNWLSKGLEELKEKGNKQKTICRNSRKRKTL